MPLRNPYTVIENLQKLSESTGLNDGLERIKKDIPWTPPESIGFIYQRIGEAVESFVPNPPIEDWHVNVVAELMILTPEQVREKFPLG